LMRSDGEKFRKEGAVIKSMIDESKYPPKLLRSMSNILILHFAKLFA
jgi:hypothetical protein